MKRKLYGCFVKIEDVIMEAEEPTSPFKKILQVSLSPRISKRLGRDGCDSNTISGRVISNFLTNVVNLKISIISFRIQMNRNIDNEGRSRGIMHKYKILIIQRLNTCNGM